MKRFSTLAILVAITLIISACGAQPAPTVNPADIAGTAQAAAQTMIAQTQAAMPTATLPPPTVAPTQTLPALPTDTPVALTPLSLPTAAGNALPTVAPVSGSGNATADPCGLTKVLAPKYGKKTTIRIWNNTKTPIAVSVFLNPTEGHQECGYRQYGLARNADVVINDLVFGCYNLWAWNTSGKPNFNSSGYGCINNSDKWTFIITTSIVKLAPP